jgi:hypothetical protein
MVREIFDELEKINDEGGRWNKSLQTLIFESSAKKCPNEAALKRKTG